MKLKTAFVALGALAAVSGPACAQNFAWGSGLKDVPAPIPMGTVTPASEMRPWGAGLKDMAVPAPVPVPAPIPVREGFSYYIRADLGYSWSDTGSYSESGNLFGTGPAPFGAAAPFSFGSSQFGPVSTGTDDIFIGTIGIGAYFLPRFRGDITLDFRGKQGYDASSTYAYTSTTAPGNRVNGVVSDTFRVRGTVAMVNGYIDILPRGAFTPYVGGGIGFVYYDLGRTHLNQEAIPTTGQSQTFSATTKSTDWSLAAALMAGVAFSLDHRWALDVGYRAQYLGGFDVELTPSNELSKASIGDHWEHQVRVGLRWNIW